MRDRPLLIRLLHRPPAFVGACLVVTVVLLGSVGPLLAPYDPNAQHHDGLSAVDGTPVAPGPKYIMGTDSAGRDELSRLLHGGRISLSVAALATAIAISIGLVFGMVSGYAGGATDMVAMRFVDFLLSLPFLLIVIAIYRLLGSPQLGMLAALLGVLSWTSLARVVRGETLKLRELPFVQAARALGASPARIVARHLLPNIIGVTVVIATTMIAQMILAESAMSYLGLGVAPPLASWGSMLREGESMLSHSPRLVMLPGLLILATVLGFNLLGEGLRDVLDPHETTD